MTRTLDDNPGYKQLAAAVIVQAVKDARSNDLAKSLDAALWLASPDVPLWLEGVGMPDFDPLSFVTSGKLRKAKGDQ